MKILITGGAGFIGYHLARNRLERWDDVTILDDMSRKGSGHRAALLKQQFAHLPQFHVIQQSVEVFPLQDRYDAIFHLAGQTAVTRSIVSPFQDFFSNLFATLALLEEVRKSGPPFPKFIYSSTNKVYGPDLLCQANEIAGGCGHEHPHPIDENFPVILRTPYGISKGAADWYVQEYGRLYQIPTVVLRQSCIYGPEQTPETDQGWIAWFTKCIQAGQAFELYGDGRQVRDILYIDDLIGLYDVMLSASYAPGEVFNIGGGPRRAVTLRRAVELIEYYTKREAVWGYGLRREGDQQYYVSDIRKIADRTKWEPTILPAEGIERMVK